MSIFPQSIQQSDSEFYDDMSGKLLKEEEWNICWLHSAINWYNAFLLVVEFQCSLIILQFMNEKD